MGWRRLGTATPVPSPIRSVVSATRARRDPEVAVERRRVEDPDTLVAERLGARRVPGQVSAGRERTGQGGRAHIGLQIRVALLDERGLGFAHVPRERTEDLRAVLQLDRVAQAGASRFAHSPSLVMYTPYSLFSAITTSARPTAVVEQLVPRRQPVQEADAHRLLGVEAPAREHELGRHRRPDDARQQVARPDVARRQSHLDEVRREERVVARDPQVAGERQASPPPTAAPCTAATTGCARLADREHQLGDVLLHHLHEAHRTAVAGARAALVAARHVGAGAEAAPGAGQHDGTDRRGRRAARRTRP